MQRSDWITQPGNNIFSVIIIIITIIVGLEHFNIMSFWAKHRTFGIFRWREKLSNSYRAALKISAISTFPQRNIDILCKRLVSV